MKLVKNIILKRKNKDKLGTKHYCHEESIILNLQEKYIEQGYLTKIKYENNLNILELKNITIKNALK